MQEDHLLELGEAAAECVERPFESLSLASPVFSTFSSFLHKGKLRSCCISCVLNTVIIQWNGICPSTVLPDSCLTSHVSGSSCLVQLEGSQRRVGTEWTLCVNVCRNVICTQEHNILIVIEWNVRLYAYISYDIWASGLTCEIEHVDIYNYIYRYCNSNACVYRCSMDPFNSSCDLLKMDGAWSFSPRCLQRDPSQRPAIPELLALPRHALQGRNTFAFIGKNTCWCKPEWSLILVICSRKDTGPWRCSRKDTLSFKNICHSWCFLFTGFWVCRKWLSTVGFGTQKSLTWQASLCTTRGPEAHILAWNQGPRSSSAFKTQLVQSLKLSHQSSPSPTLIARTNLSIYPFKMTLSVFRVLTSMKVVFRLGL